ncbi:MAG: acyl-CoA thioesterase [Rubrivivax sp.]|nr:acyl-CoA thioesterase [Rubrivivax sp.]
MSTFTATRTVRFADCDPAGIVFYPQYLVMLNDLVEQWFEDGLGLRYEQIIGERRLGLPTVRLEADFTAVSRHGDRLTLAIGLLHLGRSSLQTAARFSGEDGVLRMRTRSVLVCTSLDTHRPVALPEDLRSAMLPFLSKEAP